MINAISDKPKEQKEDRKTGPGAQPKVILNYGSNQKIEKDKREREQTSFYKNIQIILPFKGSHLIINRFNLSFHHLISIFSENANTRHLVF